MRTKCFEIQKCLNEVEFNIYEHFHVHWSTLQLSSIDFPEARSSGKRLYLQGWRWVDWHSYHTCDNRKIDKPARLYIRWKWQQPCHRACVEMMSRCKYIYLCEKRTIKMYIYFFVNFSLLLQRTFSRQWYLSSYNILLSFIKKFYIERFLMYLPKRAKLKKSEIMITSVSTPLNWKYATTKHLL